MTPATYDFTIYKGTTHPAMVITCKDDNGTAVNITGWTPYMQARKETSSPAAAISFTATVTDGPNGKVTIGALTNTATAALNEGDYGYDLLIKNTDNEVLGPFLTGKISVKALYTQPV
jgi:hypothetical protein